MWSRGRPRWRRVRDEPGVVRPRRLQGGSDAGPRATLNGRSRTSETPSPLGPEPAGARLGHDEGFGAGVLGRS